MNARPLLSALVAATLVFAAAGAPSWAAACPGDCDGDGEVTVDELVRGVAIALGLEELAGCPAFDIGGDEAVTVDEILQAVNAALVGCPRATATPSPRVTASETPTVAVPASVPASETPTVAPSPSGTATGTATVVASETPTFAPSPSASAVATPSATATAPLTASATATPPAATATGTPTFAGSETPTAAETETPSQTATVSPTPDETTPPTPSLPSTSTTTPGATATPSPTATALPTFTETPVPTPSPAPTAGDAAALARRSAGTILITTDVFLAVPELLATLASVPGFTAAGVPFTFPCPAGGTFSASCTRAPTGPPPGLGPPRHVMTFDSCAALTSERTLTADGSIVTIGGPGDTCTETGDELAFEVDALSFVLAGQSLTSTVAIGDLSGGLTLSGARSDCGSAVIAADLTGSIAASGTIGAGPAVSVEATFAGTEFAVDVAAYDASCAPADFAMVVEGVVGFAAAGRAFTVTYANYRMEAEVGDGVTSVEIDGDVQSECLGEAVRYTTAAALQVPVGLDCPSGGPVLVVGPNATDAVMYGDGAVAIDVGNDGTSDDSISSCRAPELYECVGE